MHERRQHRKPQSPPRPRLKRMRRAMSRIRHRIPRAATRRTGPDRRVRHRRNRSQRWSSRPPRRPRRPLNRAQRRKQRWSRWPAIRRWRVRLRRPWRVRSRRPNGAVRLDRGRRRMLRDRGTSDPPVLMRFGTTADMASDGRLKSALHRRLKRTLHGRSAGHRLHRCFAAVRG